MKGFPNQVADLAKIATAVDVLARLVDVHANAKNDGVFGEGLVRAGVAGTGHTPKSVDQYLAEQSLKAPSEQSFRTTARGLRELFRLMGLIDDQGQDVRITDNGRLAGSFAGQPLDQEQIAFWRSVIRNMTHSDVDGVSHPYQVLLRLVARRPGISRAKCALALEATDDSEAELNRIVALSDLDEDAIRQAIGASPSNFDNAKKVLPKFAEQLNDVIRTNGTYEIAVAPGRASEGPKEAAPVGVDSGQNRPRAPRTSRAVTPQTIAQAGIGSGSDEVAAPAPGIDPAAAAATRRLQADRLRRHNLLVKAFAEILREAGANLYEDPFDILALFAAVSILVEAKTLEADESERVREALGQLLYYEGFVTSPVVGDAPTYKVACFERAISTEHSAWLNKHGVAVVWWEKGSFRGDDLARDFLTMHVAVRLD